MRDGRMAAANDDNHQQKENEPNEILMQPGPNFKAAKECLSWAISKTQGELSTEDAKKWTIMLSHQPEWKLYQLPNESFTFLNEIWKLFDSMTLEVPTYKAPALPEPEYRSELSKDFWKHVESLGSFRDFKPKNLHENFPQGYAREREEWLKEKREQEKASLEALHAKYGQIGFDRVIRMRGL